jgi:TonB family protein
MINLHKYGALLLKGVLIAQVCLFELPCAWAQRTMGIQQLPVLGAEEVSRLVLNQTPPNYPVLARLNFIQGRVRIEIRVSPEGRVIHAHVLNGNPLFAAAVLSRVPEWRYRPLMSGGRPASFLTVVEINFSLRYKDPGSVPPDAESDFSRQVKPPEVITAPENSASNHPLVHLLLLINREGKVIDTGILKGTPLLFEAAKKSLEKWSFRPARWGTLSVPWYLEVDVPVNDAPDQADFREPNGL